MNPYDWDRDISRSMSPTPPRVNIARVFFWLALWWAGAAGLVWAGARLFDQAFGWFPTRPSWQESILVAAWFVAVYVWYIRVAILVSRD